jgi:hypothetical protein
MRAFLNAEEARQLDSLLLLSKIKGKFAPGLLFKTDHATHDGPESCTGQ